MNYINRAVENRLLKKMLPNKVIILYGPRRIGKTVFLQRLIKKLKVPVLVLNGEDMDTVEVLSIRRVEHYKRLLGNHKILIIDEAQKIPGIGMILKLMIDEIKGLKILVTGSSTFDLSNNLGEPLTGRSFTIQMFPLSQAEFSQKENLIITKARLEERLIYGNYPELIQYKSNEEKADYLKDLVSSYLLKDILEYENLKASDKMLKLLRLIAFQIGKEVSLQELGQQLEMSKNTVEKYLDLLSKVFVIYRLPGFARNLRTEIVKTSKWYFYDNGIRNTLVSNFNPIVLRNDIGELWENYILSERIKYQSYKGLTVNNYFWRTYQKQEIDWIEERSGKLYAYEMKWNENKKVKVPSAWEKEYPGSTFKVINRENYLDWINP